jgi:hypothetical protein
MARQRTQLAAEVEGELLARFRQTASARRLPLRAALEEALKGWLAAPAPAEGGGELLARVEALEAALARLVGDRQAAPAAPPPSTPPATEAAAGDRFTTQELALRTGTNAAAWNNWASPSRIGQVRQHRTAGAWRLIGKEESEKGGPLRWVWEPA